MVRAKFLKLTVAAVAGIAWGAPAASAFTPDPVDMAAAKREGSVSWYTSAPIATAQRIADLFTTKTGVKVELFRSGGEAVLRRFMQESAAGRVEADVLTTSDPAAMARLAAAGTFVPFKPANFDKIPEAVRDPEGRTIAQRLNVLAIAVLGGKVAPAARPATWSDLTKPQYKGELVMPDPSFTALQLICVATLSHKLGWGFYQGLKRNDVMIVQSHQQVEDMVKRGERPIAAEEADNYADADRKAGHDIVTIYPSEGVFAIPAPTAVVKGSAHPNAAKALAAFMIGDEVQNLFPKQGSYGARADVPPPAGNPKLASLKLMPVDYAAIEKNAVAVKEKFAEIFQ